MESEDKQIEQLQKVLTNVDDWLVKFGYISNHAHNRVIERLSKEVRLVNPGDIDYLVDNENRRVDLTLYVPLWYLLFLFIFRRRDRVLFQVIAIVEEVLAGYEIRASIARRGRREKDHALINDKLRDDGDKPESGGESELQPAQDLLPDHEEQPENQQEVRNEAKQRDLQSDEETQDPS